MVNAVVIAGGKEEGILDGSGYWKMAERKSINPCTKEGGKRMGSDVMCSAETTVCLSYWYTKKRATA